MNALVQKLGQGPAARHSQKEAGDCDPPDIQAGRDWLDRKAQTREREFQQQQREQAQERHDLRLERRLDADRRMERDRLGWPGR